MIVADRRLWLTADRSRVVEDGDPAAAFLLASQGTEIPVEEARRLGLSVEAGRVVLPGAKGGEAVDDAGEAKHQKKGKK